MNKRDHNCKRQNQLDRVHSGPIDLRFFFHGPLRLASLAACESLGTMDPEGKLLSRPNVVCFDVHPERPWVVAGFAGAPHPHSTPFLHAWSVSLRFAQ